VIARSVLLKGALTARAAALPEAFRVLKDEVAHVVAVSDGDAAQLPAYAYRYVLSHAAVASALVGTSRIDELRSAIAAAELGPLDTEAMERIGRLPALGEEWLNPGRWPKVESVC
jgi:aryl-alcohol dehydrogenase-like predicted oxidoreductase